MSSWSSSPLWLQVHIQQVCIFCLREVYWPQLYNQISQSCIDFCPEIESCLFRRGPVSSPSAFCSRNQWVTLYRFLFRFTVDGSDVIQQRSKFNMGALSSGPCVCNERKTQGQPSGQTAVSHYCSKIKKNLPLLFVQYNICFVDALIASFFSVWTSVFRFVPTARTNQSL